MVFLIDYANSIMIISDFGFVISDFKSEFGNRAEGELGESNPLSAILF